VVCIKVVEIANPRSLNQSVDDRTEEGAKLEGTGSGFVWDRYGHIVRYLPFSWFSFARSYMMPKLLQSHALGLDSLTGYIGGNISPRGCNSVPKPTEKGLEVVQNFILSSFYSSKYKFYACPTS
jgi:hypothetical protein